tara:strand:- start:1273 stop:1413 length:141 start_codon:yes stop_codon:yes gene_type:complete
MTQNQFLWLCNRNTVDPDVALENDDLRNALQARDDAKVEKIFMEEF